MHAFIKEEVDLGLIDPRVPLLAGGRATGRIHAPSDCFLSVRILHLPDHLLVRFFLLVRESADEPTVKYDVESGECVSGNRRVGRADGGRKWKGADEDGGRAIFAAHPLLLACSVSMCTVSTFHKS